MRRSSLVLVAAAAACSSSTGPKTPPTPDFVGTWSVVTVNDTPLPDTVGPIAGSGGWFLMQDATLVLSDDGKTDSLVANYYISGSSTIITNVDYISPLDNGTEIAWHDHGDSTDAITVTSDTLVLTTARLPIGSKVYKFERTSR